MCRHALVIGLVALATCGTPTPPVPPTPPTPAVRTVNVTVRAGGAIVRSGLTQIAIDTGDVLACQQQADGRQICPLHTTTTAPFGAFLDVTGVDAYLPLHQRFILSGAPVQDLPDQVLPPAGVAGRHGIVRRNGRGVQDDDGPFLGVCASYFPLFYMQRDEPDRLEPNLKALEGADCIRVIADVFWPGRDSGAARADFWAVVDKADQRAAAHGLRLEISISGGSPAFPTVVQQTAFADQWAVWGTTHPGRIWSIEIGNEGFLGTTNQNTAAGLRSLAQRLVPRVPYLVTSSSPGYGGLPVGCEPFALTLPHYRRGPWPSYAIQPWGGQCASSLVGNDEPVGIQSSVSQDPDARHQATASVITWISSNAWFVLHSGAGVYAAKCTGTNPPISGCPFPGIIREANLLDQPTFAPTLSSILGLRKLLPPDLPNWTRINGSWSNSPISGIGGVLEGRCYFAVQGARFIGACAGADVLALPITAARPMTLDVYDPLGPVLLQHATLATGQRIPFPGGLDAYVLVEQ